ncbi:MAG: hypothetical protein K9I99_15080 [Melioribacteraceae bacterium]|nr:hypothetical protein [Melioribacteraceae bacterium]MCF8414548.1 hypothetical protein [Melioribacteraceae bacterium]
MKNKRIPNYKQKLRNTKILADARLKGLLTESKTIINGKLKTTYSVKGEVNG